MKLLPYIIAFVFGIIIGYLIQVPTGFEGYVKYIFGFISLGLIIEVVRMFKDWNKERKEKVLTHSKLLVDRNLRFRANTYIGFVNDFNCDLRIQIKNLNQTEPESEKYSKEVDAHLKSKYEKGNCSILCGIHRSFLDDQS